MATALQLVPSPFDEKKIKIHFYFDRFDKEEEITVDWAVDAKIPEGRWFFVVDNFDIFIMLSIYLTQRYPMDSYNLIHLPIVSFNELTF